ncbi:MAG: hypothetical protein ACOYOM_15465 [Chloroflexota bacterium]
MVELPTPTGHGIPAPAQTPSHGIAPNPGRSETGGQAGVDAGQERPFMASATVPAVSALGSAAALPGPANLPMPLAVPALPPSSGVETAIAECARTLGTLSPTDPAYASTLATMQSLLARRAPVRLEAGVIVDESQPVGRLQRAGDIAGVIIVMVMAGLILLSGSLWYEWGTPQTDPITTIARETPATAP